LELFAYLLWQVAEMIKARTTIIRATMVVVPMGYLGPLVGAGLPVLAVGYGAYWLVRRYRRKSDV
jgi:hypothetical protein